VLIPSLQHAYAELVLPQVQMMPLVPVQVLPPLFRHCRLDRQSPASRELVLV
jgi:hypothetical protein